MKKKANSVFLRNVNIEGLVFNLRKSLPISPTIWFSVSTNSIESYMATKAREFTKAWFWNAIPDMQENDPENEENTKNFTFEGVLPKGQENIKCLIHNAKAFINVLSEFQNGSDIELVLSSEGYVYAIKVRTPEGLSPRYEIEQVAGNPKSEHADPDKDAFKRNTSTDTFISSVILTDDEIKTIKKKSKVILNNVDKPTLKFYSVDNWFTISTPSITAQEIQMCDKNFETVEVMPEYFNMICDTEGQTLYIKERLGDPTRKVIIAIGEITKTIAVMPTIKRINEEQTTESFDSIDTGFEDF